jgi:hypothetical protein
MKNEYAEKRTRRFLTMRSIMDFGMGILYLAVGLFIMFPQVLGFGIEAFDKIFRYMFGGLCVVYGTWRIYRGIKKDYL